VRFIKVNFPASQSDSVAKILEDHGPLDWSIDQGYGRFEKAIEIVVERGNGQELLDAFQNLFSATKDWRIVVLPVEATLPRKEEPPKQDEPANGNEEQKKKSRNLALREELYQKVEKDCAFNLDFVVLTILSAIVAAIGLNSDSVAIVIAAMVIAPLLGPILAFAFGASLGDLKLMMKSGQTALMGLAIGFLMAFLIAKFVPLNMESKELLDRTVLSPAIVALALASGAAAALSLSTGLSSALVGVMVAVALLPPAVASAMFLGGAEYGLAMKAAILLAFNVVCAILSAQLVFVWKGVRPRTWLEQKQAGRSVMINAVIWIGLLAALALLSFEAIG